MERNLEAVERARGAWHSRFGEEVPRVMYALAGWRSSAAVERQRCVEGVDWMHGPNVLVCHY